MQKPVDAATGPGATGSIPADRARSANGPIDFDHLAKYTLGNVSLEKELLTLFRSQADIYIERLTNAADETEWKYAAHSLKGSARGLGAWEMGALAEQAEQKGIAAQQDMLPRLDKEISQLKTFIDDFLNG